MKHHAEPFRVRPGGSQIIQPAQSGQPSLLMVLISCTGDVYAIRCLNAGLECLALENIRKSLEYHTMPVLESLLSLSAEAKVLPMVGETMQQ